MEWYLAKLVYRFQPSTDKGLIHFDEQIRLIEAEDILHAFHKAQLIGVQEELHIKNDQAPDIRWTFIDVTELYELNKEMDGAEILSQLHQTNDPEGHQKNIRLKAGYLLSNCTEQFLQAY